MPCALVCSLRMQPGMAADEKRYGGGAAVMSMPSLNQSIALFFLAESLLYTRKGVLRHITAQHPMESQMRCTRPSDSVLSLQVHEILGHRVGKVLPCQRGLFTNRLCSRDFGEGLCGVCFSRFSQRRWLQGPLFLCRAWLPSGRPAPPSRGRAAAGLSPPGVAEAPEVFRREARKRPESSGALLC